jgi:hypothetical protein
MATKKTDRPIGRPKKPIMPFSVRRARGRPELDFDHDNDRYFGAIVWATQAANRISLTRAARIVAAIQCGNEITGNEIDCREDRKTVQKILSSCPDGKIAQAFGPRETHADGLFVNTRPSQSPWRALPACGSAARPGKPGSTGASPPKWSPPTHDPRPEPGEKCTVAINEQETSAALFASWKLWAEASGVIVGTQTSLVQTIKGKLGDKVTENKHVRDMAGLKRGLNGISVNHQSDSYKDY